MTKKQQNKRPILVAGALFPYPFYDFNNRFYEDMIRLNSEKFQNFHFQALLVIFSPS